MSIRCAGLNYYILYVQYNLPTHSYRIRAYCVQYDGEPRIEVPYVVAEQECSNLFVHAVVST